MPKFTVDLHPGQSQVYRCKKRYRAMACGRRTGKTRLGLHEAIVAALAFPGQVDPIAPHRVMLAMPTLQQAKGILWEPLVSLFETQLSDYCDRINRADHIIYLKGGKPPIYVRGANDKDGDTLRGNRLYYLYADEYQDWKPNIIDSVIRPAMADGNLDPDTNRALAASKPHLFQSRILAGGTPKGKLNHFYDWVVRKPLLLDSHAGFIMPTIVNNRVPGLREEIEELRLVLPPRLFRQEMEASFEDFPGKIYYELDESNLVDGAPDSFDLIVFGKDFGDVNPAVCVLGLVNECWYFLEGWHPTEGVPVPDPVQDEALLALARKYRAPRMAMFCDPSRPSAILAIRALGKQHDLKVLKSAQAGYNPIEEGINQVHSLVYQKRLLFANQASSDDDYSKRTQAYVSPYVAWQMMSSYHRKVDSQGNVTEHVSDGQDDHICDSIRYSLAKKGG